MPSSRFEKLASEAGEFGSRVREFAEDASDRSLKAGKYAVRQVREHPVTTLAVGAAVGGLVVWWLLRDRD
jgi:ElaB/YqjD/DUF883 family membrane-anchored ribosome-binding protein